MHMMIGDTTTPRPPQNINFPQHSVFMPIRASHHAAFTSVPQEKSGRISGTTSATSSTPANEGNSSNEHLDTLVSRWMDITAAQDSHHQDDGGGGCGGGPPMPPGDSSSQQQIPHDERAARTRSLSSASDQAAEILALLDQHSSPESTS